MTHFLKELAFARGAICVKGGIAFGTPFSGGFKGIFPANEILVLDREPAPGTKGMWLVPERYKHFEAIFVPDHDRAHRTLGGYAFAIEYTQVGRRR